MSELRPCPRFCKEDEWGEKVPTHMEHCEKNPVTKLVVENAALKVRLEVAEDKLRCIAKIAAQAGGNDARINKELDAGDSWAWIRAKFERSGDKYRWYKPRTDELVGTRYEVMGWLHCLFADTDPTVFIDITLEHQKRTDEAEAENDALKAQVKRLEAPVSDEELQPLHDKYGYFDYGDAQGDVSRKFVNDLLSARTAAPTTGAGGRQRCG